MSWAARALSEGLVFSPLEEKVGLIRSAFTATEFDIYLNGVSFEMFINFLEIDFWPLEIEYFALRV